MTDEISQEAHDPELVRDFLDEFEDAYEAIERTLRALDGQPDDAELLNDLFRNIHSVKSNLRMMQLNTYSDMVHAVENVLERVRQEELAFEHRLSRIMLLSISHVRELCELNLSDSLPAVGHTDVFFETMQALTRSEPGQHDAAMARVLQLIDPDYEEQRLSAPADDLPFFASLARFLEQRSPYWAGRTERIAELAQHMNEAAGSPVDAAQLRAAACMHDLGMAFVPLELLHQASALSVSQHERLRTHPSIAADLVNQLGGWDEAATIVRQHHEWDNGDGYPQGLGGEAICDGAMILAIADSFDAMTHERPERAQRRTLLRAISEINGLAHVQFAKYWVDIFNTVMRSRVVRSNG